MKKYNEFVIEAVPFNSDLLSGVLWELDIEGINEDNDLLFVFSSENSNCSKTAIEEILEKLKTQNLIETFKVDEFQKEEENWNEEWEKKLNIIHVSDRFVIRPSFKEYELKENEIELLIDPKMSFGTGEHETTRLVLRFLEKQEIENKKVMDVGSGTGVLAIAAAKLGASKVIAFDNDEWCLMNGSENIEQNDVADIVDVRLGTIKNIEETGFDLVTANINKHILMDLPESLFQKIAAGGRLILSGLLNVDEKDIKNKYGEAGFNFIEMKSEGEWIALLFKK